jgi:hypothetical protein
MENLDEGIWTAAVGLWECGKVERFTAKLFQAAVEIRIQKMPPKATDASRISIGAAFPQAFLFLFWFFFLFLLTSFLCGKTGLGRATNRPPYCING